MFQCLHVSFMFCIKFPKRRLKLIFKMRCLWVFDFDICIEAKWLIFRYDFYGFSFFLFVSGALSCICKNFLQNIIFFEALLSVFFNFYRCFLEISHKKNLFFFLDKNLFTSLSSKRVTQAAILLGAALLMGMTCFRGS